MEQGARAHWYHTCKAQPPLGFGFSTGMLVKVHLLPGSAHGAQSPALLGLRITKPCGAVSSTQFPFLRAMVSFQGYARMTVLLPSTQYLLRNQVLTSKDPGSDCALLAVCFYSAVSTSLSISLLGLPKVPKPLDKARSSYPCMFLMALGTGLAPVVGNGPKRPLAQSHPVLAEGTELLLGLELPL